MTLRVDPAGNEIRALRRVTDWRGTRVIELGCGDGRLTRRLAGLGAVVDALDPDAGRIRAALRLKPKRLAGRIRFSVGSARHIERPSRSAQVVVFAWSL